MRKRFLILCSLLILAAPGYCDITTEKDASDHVYSLTNVFNWSENNPPMIQVIKGYYAPEGENLDRAGISPGFGVISVKTWNELGLKDDRLYKEGDKFIIERNVCILPSVTSRAEITAANFTRLTRGARLVRVRETLTNASYGYEVIEVITENPPLRELFHTDE